MVDQNGYGGAVSSAWTALILLLAVFFIVREILSQPEITLQSIFGVLSAYMMIGLIYSAVYVAVWKFTGQPFFVGVAQNDTNTKQFQYFSFTTLTTLGYGDFTAVGDGGRAIAVLEAIVGQMFLATLVARLVAGFRWSDRAAARHGAARRPRPRSRAHRPAARAGTRPARCRRPHRLVPEPRPSASPASATPARATPAPDRRAPGGPAPALPGLSRRRRRVWSG